VILRDAIANLDSIPDAATLFVERIGGHFRAESSALLHELTEQEIRLPIGEVAAKVAPGLDYFLEVDIAREVVEGLKANHSDVAPSLELSLECIIYYAENDAYPPAFF
jgi:hypothetical protein